MTTQAEGEQLPHDDAPAAREQNCVQCPHLDDEHDGPDGNGCRLCKCTRYNDGPTFAPPAQYAESFQYHEDGSTCTHRDIFSCPIRLHYSEFGLSQIGIQPNKEQSFNHEGPADFANLEGTGYSDEFRSGGEGTPEQRDGNVGELIDGRVDVYGDPVMGFMRHAQVWSGILGIEVQPWQVALCMLGYKLVRTGITPDYSDNSDDIEGYLDIFRQLMPDMVQARDTAEYLAGGGQGARA